ncbi:MAG: alpha/beta fold hydrolase, partial [Candidatus Omnitrophica bacterium]|nr:alpha/beta fold hydrolase [Candidatus Omnitrophota bacterium]
PVYGLQSPGLEDDSPPLTTIENMAAQYMGVVTDVHNGGPIHLLGWSFGGVVAYEMARQLNNKGYRVGTLTLIDSFIPLQHKYPVFKKSTDDSTLMGYLVEHLEGMFGKPLRVSRSQLQKLGPEEQLRYVLKCAIAAEVLPASFQLDQMQHFYAVYKANHLAFCRYRPQPYEGDITLFCPQKQLFMLSRANTQAWKKLAGGGVNVFPIPGDHYTMMQGESSAMIARHVKDNINDSNRSILPGGHA